MNARNTPQTNSLSLARNALHLALISYLFFTMSCSKKITPVIEKQKENTEIKAPVEKKSKFSVRKDDFP